MEEYPCPEFPTIFGPILIDAGRKNKISNHFLREISEVVGSRVRWMLLKLAQNVFTLVFVM